MTSKCLRSACSELQHSNVLRFIDVFPFVDGPSRRMCVITEFAPDGNLWHAMEACPPLQSRAQVPRKSTWNLFPYTEAAARCIVQQVVLAVQYMHAKEHYGVCLRPQNVLMSQWWMQKPSKVGVPEDFAPIVVLSGFQYASRPLVASCAGLTIMQVCYKARPLYCFEIASSGLHPREDWGFQRP
jgi:hypothetical protein